MTLDTATLVALIGFCGAVIGSLGAVATKYYLDNRRERQRKEQRIANLRKYGYPDEESRIRNALEREIGTLREKGAIHELQQRRKVSEIRLRSEIRVSQLTSEIRELRLELERKERELELEKSVSELRLLNQITELQLESEISALRKDGEIRELQIELGIKPKQEETETTLQLPAPLEDEE